MRKHPFSLQIDEKNNTFLDLIAKNCPSNNLSLNYDSGTENTAFLQIFSKNSTDRKHGELTAFVLFSVRAIFDINWDSIVKFTKLCTIDCTRNNLSYFYSTTDNKWDSSNSKVNFNAKR